MLLFLFPATTTCLGQHYPILPVPGSPHGIVSMMQDSKSRIWVGTADDMLCFDGGRFYSIRPYGFPKEKASTLAEDNEGGIWIGTQGTAASGGGHGGLYRYLDGHVEKILSDDVISVVKIAPEMMLASLATGKDGTAAFGDLYRIRKDKGRWKPEKMLTAVAKLISVDHQGTALFPCPSPKTLCELPRLQIIDWVGETIGLSSVRGMLPSDVERVIRDKFGCLWFRTEDAADYQCPGDLKGTTLPDSQESLDSSAFLEEAPDGAIMMLGGIAVGRPGRFQTFGRHLGMPKGALNAGLIAKDGTIWLGGGDGLYRFMYPFHLEYWNDEESGTGSPYALLHANGKVYAGSNGVVILDRGRRNWSQAPARKDLGTVTALAGGPGQTVFAASIIRGVEQISSDGRLIAKSQFGAGGAALATDRAGRVWLGSGTGPVQVVRNGARLKLLPEEVNKTVVLSMSYDAARDALWACYDKEVLLHRDGRWIHIGARDGLLDMGCMSVAVASNGDAWLGYSGAAFALIKPMTGERFSVRNYSSSDRIGDATSNFMGIDHQGTVWRGGDAADYFASAENAEAGQWIKLDQQDGIPTPGGNQNAFFADQDGSIWFGSAGSIVHFAPPQSFATDFPSPLVFLSGFTSGNGGFVPSDVIQPFPHGKLITAHIGSLQFDRRNAIHLRYRLLPEQSTWQTASSFDVALGKLHWGNHRLQVQAQLSTGPWSAIVEESFTVLKPLWITGPVITAYIAAFISSAFGLRAWRKRRAARAKKKFPELANWRLAALSPELNQLAGTLIEARFEVGPIVARGGFATVARGRDLQQHGLLCAIKIFRQELMDKDWLARRFQQEVRALASIDHPNVVRIYGHGATAAGTPYLVMEFIEGITLRKRLDQGSLTPRTTASYLRQTGSALDEIHAHDICHRDLKPENLMIRKDAASGREIVLIDFSIAIVKDPDETMHGLSRAAGTLYYMAPEQAIGYADPSTDIYSLSKVVIEMLTGRCLSDLLPNASMDLSERVRELLAGLPMRLSTPAIELLSSALEFDPARRPKLAGVFAETIAADLEHGAAEQGAAEQADRKV